MRLEKFNTHVTLFLIEKNHLKTFELKFILNYSYLKTYLSSI